MNIIEAFKSGDKKIRRKIWTEDIYMFSSQSSMFHAEDILADDWEVYDNRLTRKIPAPLTPYGEIQNLRKILREYLKDYSLAYNYYDCSYEDDGSDLKSYLNYLDKEIKNNLKKLREQLEKFED